MSKTLYERLGGYDAIAAVVSDVMPKLQSDAKLRRFWDYRSDDGIAREKQLLIDFLCHSAGGDAYYTGRDMKTAHKGMGIDDDDWDKAVAYLAETLTSFSVPEAEKKDVLGFFESFRQEIVE